MLLERGPLLSTLARQLASARRGHGRAAFVAGEAGIGKTTLLRAFCDSRAATAQILWGTCDAVAAGRPLAPFADIAEQVGGRLREALEATDRQRVLDALIDLRQGTWSRALSIRAGLRSLSH